MSFEIEIPDRVANSYPVSLSLSARMTVALTPAVQTCKRDRFSWAEAPSF